MGCATVGILVFFKRKKDKEDGKLAEDGPYRDVSIAIRDMTSTGSGSLMPSTELDSPSADKGDYYLPDKITAPKGIVNFEQLKFGEVVGQVAPIS